MLELRNNRNYLLKLYLLQDKLVLHDKMSIKVWIKIVKQISVKLALKSRLEEEKTLGIIKNIPKGFKIPPVK